MADEWDVSLPVDRLLISKIPDEIRKVTAKVETVIEKEHRALGDGNSGGEHTQGSAITFFLATASAPTTNPDGSAFAAADLGRLWLDTTTHQLKVLVATTPTWKIIPTTAAAIALLSTLDVAGNFSVGTDKATIAAATGNTVLAGTLGVTGVMTTTAASVLGDGSTLAAATEAGDGVRTIVDKAYADTKEATLVTQATASTFGTLVTTDTTPATLVKDTVYKAACDGFLHVYITAVNDWIKFYTDDTDATTLRLQETAASTGSGDNKACGFCVPVKKDDYVKITAQTNAPTISWLPIGTGGLVDQS